MPRGIVAHYARPLRDGDYQADNRPRKAGVLRASLTAR
jgi:hypothetical protein